MNEPHNSQRNPRDGIEGKGWHMFESSRPLFIPRSPPSERKIKSRMSKPNLEPVIEGDQHLMRDVQTLLPGDVTRVGKKKSQSDLARRRSNYFEQVFMTRENGVASDKMRGEFLVLAEVKTNVVVDDEYVFVAELSDTLAQRYHRPTTSIVVTLQHSACIMFGGSCGPAYTMTIEALADQVQTATNKRNVALLQRHMEQALGIPASRGFLRFMPISEDCAGWRGKTMAGEAAGTEEHIHPEVETRDAKVPRRGSSKIISRGIPSATTSTHGSDATSRGKSSEVLGLGGVPGNNPALGGGKDDSKVIRRRKSFIQALFPRTVRTADERVT